MADFKVYLLVAGDLRRVAECDDDSLGFTLLTLSAEGQLDGGRVGVMYRRDDTPERGSWLINPFGPTVRRKEMRP